MNVAIDLDQTLCHGVGMDAGAWLPGAADAVRKLRANGVQVIVHTCRATWVAGGGIPEVERVLALEGFTGVAVFDSWSFHPVDQSVLGIWAGTGKPVAYAYVDDRAVRYLPHEDTWPALADALLHLNPRRKDDE